jgi:hypothetical protein
VAIALLEENKPFGGFEGDVQFAYPALLDIRGRELVQLVPIDPMAPLTWPDALFATSAEGEG